ncbi:hypothetical protein SUDANB1_05639 [Streptomyces sp. enrichment culture]|uniref:DUF6409 family protein n=1 Tax=Streptomyces sp. enrichment culture TaxID=1795815 RepID=UPI003F552C91
MNATATTTATFQPGDVVTGRPMHEGKPQARRKGIVLGLFGTDPNGGYVVWWYGKGEASVANSSLMFTRELKKTGDIHDFSYRQTVKVFRACGEFFDRARTVRYALQRHGIRMRNARRDQ